MKRSNQPTTYYRFSILFSLITLTSSLQLNSPSQSTTPLKTNANIHHKIQSPNLSSNPTTIPPTTFIQTHSKLSQTLPYTSEELALAEARLNENDRRILSDNKKDQNDNTPYPSISSSSSPTGAATGSATGSATGAATRAATGASPPPQPVPLTLHHFGEIQFDILTMTISESKLNFTLDCVSSISRLIDHWKSTQINRRAFAAKQADNSDIVLHDLEMKRLTELRDMAYDQLTKQRATCASALDLYRANGIEKERKEYVKEMKQVEKDMVKIRTHAEQVVTQPRPSSGATGGATGGAKEFSGFALKAGKYNNANGERSIA